jgi:hypothetical protein
VEPSILVFDSYEERAGGWRGEREFKLAKKAPHSDDTLTFEFAPGY